MHETRSRLLNVPVASLLDRLVTFRISFLLRKLRDQLLFRILCLVTSLAMSSCATLPRRYVLEHSPAEPIHRPAKLINLNRAAAAELEQLPGIGKVMAERIVAHRLSYGRFRKKEHLMMVRGISERRFREIEEHCQLTIDD